MSYATWWEAHDQAVADYDAGREPRMAVGDDAPDDDTHDGYSTGWFNANAKERGFALTPPPQGYEREERA